MDTDVVFRLCSGHCTSDELCAHLTAAKNVLQSHGYSFLKLPADQWSRLKPYPILPPSLSSQNSSRPFVSGVSQQFESSDEGTSSAVSSSADNSASLANNSTSSATGSSTSPDELASNSTSSVDNAMTIDEANSIVDKLARKRGRKSNLEIELLRQAREIIGNDTITKPDETPSASQSYKRKKYVDIDDDGGHNPSDHD